MTTLVITVVLLDLLPMVLRSLKICLSEKQQRIYGRKEEGREEKERERERKKGTCSHSERLINAK